MVDVQICVIAHNEQEHIIGCLKSIEQALEYAQIQHYTVHIINNGSTDDTQLLAEQFCDNKVQWFAHNIVLGDKANAWNLGLYQYATNNVLTIYIDGDCRMTKESIEAFRVAQQNNPEAYILAAIPLTRGNTTQATITKTLQGNALSGNLFALTPLFIQKTRQLHFKLPIGLIGDDSLLAWVSSHDFKLSNGIVTGKLIGVADAKFEYHRLTPTSISNLKLYWRRLHRYSLRHLQQCCIRSFLDEHDEFAQLPEHISMLYPRVKASFIREHDLLARYFDKKAYQQICNTLKNTVPNK
jgi:glycosyltransferase involved in cell wall biosynthesis